MKKTIIYWSTTGIFAFMMLFSAFNYFTNDTVKAAFIHLGFPDYFRIELAIAKILGVAALLIPMKSEALKYSGYTGFTIVLLSASIAHLSIGDPFKVAVMPMFFLFVLALSFFYYKELFEKKEIIRN
jgi:hypothetical protein